jgi:anaerobic ribonucleoside-triphosphate reductase activating protein
MTTPIRLSRMHYPVTTLGPGARLGIWMQGCSIQCPGCISVDTWTTQTGGTTVEAILEMAEPWLKQADGVTVSGGEPFDQPEALCALLTGLHARACGDVLVFTGHTWEAIARHVTAMPGLIDALVSDPFVIDAPQTRALRGSDNQRLHLLTPLGRRRFAAYERSATAADRRLDVMFDDEGVVWLAGIPARGDLEALRRALEGAGHHILTSEDRSPLVLQQRASVGHRP